MNREKMNIEKIINKTREIEEPADNICFPLNDDRFNKSYLLSKQLKDIIFAIDNILTEKINYLTGINNDESKSPPPEEKNPITWLDQIINTQMKSLKKCEMILKIIENM